MCERALAISLSLGVLALSACKPARVSEAASRGGIELGVLPDAELFKRNDGISFTLSQEIRRQLLKAFAHSNALKEINGESNDLVLSEIGIAKTKSTVWDIDVSKDLHVSPRSKEMPPKDYYNVPPPPLGAGMQTTYHLLTSEYNLQFSFEDRKARGQVFRFPLTHPLVVEENVKMTSRVQISINAIAALPTFLRGLVARFYQDIGASLNMGMSWQGSSGLSSAMYYKSGNNGVTPLMFDFMKDVVYPVCLSAAENRGIDRSRCKMTRPVLEDPLEELARRITTKVRVVRRCEATDLYENTKRIYKLYVDVPQGKNVFIPGTKAYLFRRVQNGWERGVDLTTPGMNPFEVFLSVTHSNKLVKTAVVKANNILDPAWTTILEAEKTSACLSPERNVTCMAMRFGAWAMNEAKCRDITAGFLTIGVSNEDVKNIVD